MTAPARKPRPQPAKRGAKTRSYHHGDLARALIEASLAILRDDGTGALTLRAAARRAGVSHAAPKNHFGDLTGLLDAVAAVGFRQLAAALRDAKAQVVAASGSAFDVFQACGQAYLRFALASPGHFRAMFHPSLSRTSEGERAEASRDAFGVIVEVIGDAQKPGLLREGDARELALTAWSIVHGLSTLALDQHLERKGFTGDPIALFGVVSTNLVIGLAGPALKPP